MYIIMLSLVLAQTPQTEGIAFFKIVNKSASSLEIEVTNGDKFAQIVIIKPGDNHLMPVKSGNYFCGIKNGDKKDCKITAGQIVQIDLPWEVATIKKPEPTESKKPQEKKTWDFSFSKQLTFDAKEVDEGFQIHPPEVVEDPKIIKKAVKKEEELQQKDYPNQAIVELNGVPSDGIIWFDGIKATTNRRWYASPKLTPNQPYYYMIKAQVERNGHVYVDTRQVLVIGGRKTVVNFNLPK